MGAAWKAWTKKEVNILLEMKRDGATHAEVLAALGRTAVSRVCDWWKRYGTPKRQRRLTPRLEARVRRLHAEGHPMLAVARRVGVCERTMRKWFARLGLVPNGKDSPQYREARRRELRCRAHRQGQTMTEQRLEMGRVRAAHMGWPGAETPRQAEVLSLLESGPKTAAEVGAALGLRRSRSVSGGKVYWLDHAATYHLKRLAALGLVGARRGDADGRKFTYRLADGVRRHEPAGGAVERNRQGSPRKGRVTA